MLRGEDSDKAGNKYREGTKVIGNTLIFLID